MLDRVIEKYFLSIKNKIKCDSIPDLINYCLIINDNIHTIQTPELIDKLHTHIQDYDFINQNDYNLFSGKLGLLYQLIRILSPHSCINVFCPIEDSETLYYDPNLLNKGLIKYCIIKRFFPKTLIVCDKYFFSLLREIIDELRIERIYLDFVEKVRERLKGQKGTIYLAIDEILEIEYSKLNLFQKLRSKEGSKITYVNNFKKIWDILSLENKEFNEQKFQTSPMIVNLNNHFNWPNVMDKESILKCLEDPASQAGKLYHSILYYDESSIVYELQSFVLWKQLLKYFENITAVKTALIDIKDNIKKQNDFFFWQVLKATNDPNKSTFIETLDERVTFYIRYFLSLQILLPVD